MKKITNLLMLLLLAMCGIGASAETATLTYDNIQVYKNGSLVTPTSSYSYNHQVRSTTDPLITISIGTGDVVYNTSKFCFGNNNRTYTLAIDGNYVITAFTINYTRGSGVKFTSNGVTSEDDGILAVTGISTASTTFTASWTSSGSSASWQTYAVESIVVEYDVPGTEWNYNYTLFDAIGNSPLNSGSGSVTSTSAGYTFTAPAVDGYAFVSAEDAITGASIDLTKTITATDLKLNYVPYLTDLANSSETIAYTITSPRGYFYAASADATQFTSTMTGKADPTNPLHTWTFVENGGNYYLYNVGANKFASVAAIKGHDLVTSAPVTIGGVASTYKSGYPIVITFALGSDTYYMNMNSSGVMIDDWSTHDEGNVLQIVPVLGVTVAPEAYSVNFTCTGGGLTSVYVDGTEVALGTDVLLTSGATVSSSTTVNAIESYNGFATLAEALADANFAGTVDVALVQNITDITLNVTRGTTVIKTVTVTGVPEGTTVNVAEAVGSPAYVSDITPAEVVGTTENQTVAVTYTSSLPMELADDPENPDATAYLMTLRTTYAHGNVSSASTYDLSDQTYYWVFGGDEFNGITVYNRGNGYMSVGSTADNSVATFGSTPTAFEIKPNDNETNGFNLNIPGTNAYINRRDSKVSTWLSANANNEVGSCLVVYTVNEAISNLITSDIDPYFDYAGCVNALQVTDAINLWPEYNALKNAPNYNDYLTFKAKVEGYQMVEATEGYYLILSGLDAFRTKQSVDKAMLYNTSSKKVAWGNADASAAQIMKLKAVEGTTTFRLYVPLAGTYLQTKAGVTTEDEASGIAFEVVAKKPSKVALVYNADGGTDAALHTAGHNSGAGVSGSLTGWTTDGDASMWHLIPANIDEITLISPEGVADGEEVVQAFANPDNVQLPLNIGVYTISEEIATGAHLDTIATSQIAGGEGYIIKGVKGATVPLLPIGEVDVPQGNLLVAGTGNIVNGGFMLAYKKGEDVAKFWPITSLTVPTNRSYLPEGTPTRGLENIFGGIGEDVTGINGVTTGEYNGVIYDLQGRRVNKAQKGVYIIGGKKVVK